MAKNTAIILSTCVVGKSPVPATNVCQNFSIAAFAIPIYARPAKEGGPTPVNILGCVVGEGNPSVIKRLIYLLHKSKDMSIPRILEVFPAMMMGMV